MPSAFVVMPFREPFESLYSQAIHPALTEAGITPLRSDQINSSVDIVADLTRQILEADLVIVEATIPNPNVYFEFGFAFANEKEFILLAQRGTVLPFDTRQIRHLFYDSAGIEQLREDFDRWLSTTKVLQRTQKRPHAWTMQRGELFPELFDSAILTEQFDVPMEKTVIQEINKGEMIPCLHSYSTDTGTDSWLRLCGDPLYSVFHESLMFLNDSANQLLDALPISFIRSCPDFVSLGPGNGLKDRTILRALSSKLTTQNLTDLVYYYPIDISPRMLATAITAIFMDNELNGRAKAKALLGDFEKLRLFAPVYDFRPEPNIFSLLGNTLGNLMHDGDFLKKVYRAMHIGDVLLLEVRTKQNQLSLSGTTTSQYALSFAPLGHLGVTFESEKLRVAREDALSQIPGTVSLAVHYKNFIVRGSSVDDLILSWINFYDPELLIDSLTRPAIGFKLLKSFELKNLVLLVMQK